METTYYAPLAGTNAREDPWVVDGQSPHTRYMRRHHFEPLRLAGGEVWNWRTTLQGLWWQGEKIWREDAKRFADWMSSLPYWARIAFAHSHGGQLPIIACSEYGLKLRALVTLGTPVRRNLNAAAAAANIGCWLHVYDVDKDTIQTLKRLPSRLGQAGDWHFSFERRFLIPGVQNIGLKDIDHSRMVRDEAAFHNWEDKNILALVQTSPTHER